MVSISIRRGRLDLAAADVLAEERALRVWFEDVVEAIGHAFDLAAQPRHVVDRADVLRAVVVTVGKPGRRVEHGGEVTTGDGGKGGGIDRGELGHARSVCTRRAAECRPPWVTDRVGRRIPR